jgi:hypothetical protein
MRVISYVAEKLAVSKMELCSKQLVTRRENNPVC